MPPPEGRRRALWRAGELLLVVAAGVWALGFQGTLPSRLPSEADHQAAAAHLAKEARPGDVLLLHPWWTERARVFAPPELPVVGYLGSDGDPLTRHPRLWVLSQPELPRAGTGAFERAFTPGRERLAGPFRFGTLELSLWRNGRHQPLRFSAADALAEAKVWLEEPGGARTPCAWDGQAHRCPGGPVVATQWHEVRFEPRRCVWMPPPAGQRVLAVQFAQAPAADRLVLEAGLTWDRGFHHDARLSPVDVHVDAPDRQVLFLTVPVGVEGLQRAETTGPGAPAPLTLRASSRNPELRDLCVDLFAYGPAGSAG